MYQTFNRKALLVISLVLIHIACNQPSADRPEVRRVITLDSWKFTRSDIRGSELPGFDDSDWKVVTVPHDWAIKGPFDKEIDKQLVKIEQNNEVVASEKTGRTGALPFIGVGWYRTKVNPKKIEGKKVLLTFDGAMSNATVFVNGNRVGERPYGYSYFYFDITKDLKQNKENLIAVRLENLPFSSRWYPGAGLYRKVQLIVKNEVSFKHWGNFITTSQVSTKSARVHIKSEVTGNGDLGLTARILNAAGEEVAVKKIAVNAGVAALEIGLNQPNLWSPNNPYLYTAELELYKHDKLVDSESIHFGVRSISFTAEDGFQLNGQTTKFKGVCLHHDLGPLGTAVNKAALRRQMVILKDLGCNAIRSAHNMPSIEQLELADEMGFLFLAESFDEWKKPKVPNGYNLYFDEWAERDVENLVRATRNHPSIVMWSAGNEVPDQWGDDGVERMRWIQDVFHREDPTRPVTIGMDQVKAVMANGFGAIPDIPGLNYRVHLYEEAFETFPQGLLLGSETASTVSSRGVYKFPLRSGFDLRHKDLQCSSYDLEYCSWSNLPEDDFVMQDDADWVIGEFVWTGFDYLGEPTPYDEYWPAHSSYFGMIDLAGIPKDRYYLYRSRWNTEDETLHILPHWTWPGREGQVTPVFVYTSYDSAELFVNGKSQGIRRKNENSKLERYRLMWNDVVYEPGELKAITYDEFGKQVKEATVRTAGEPHHLVLEADRKKIKADGQDLSFVTISVVDEAGNLCTKSNKELEFAVSGAGSFKAVCNGDPTSLELFHVPRMKAFNGKLVVIVQSGLAEGDAVLKVGGEGLVPSYLQLSVVNQAKIDAPHGT